MQDAWIRVKFIYSEKATKFDKNLPIDLKLLSNVKKIGIYFENFVAFSECLNFKRAKIERFLVNLSIAIICNYIHIWQPATDTYLFTLILFQPKLQKTGEITYLLSKVHVF